MPARQALAAIFHDVVYYQLDGGFPARLAGLLTPVTRQQGQGLQLLPPEPADVPLQLCLDLFGFQPGELLAVFGGMNEFLSAVVAVRLLQTHLGLAELLAVVACIEATIPFRGPGTDGRDCSTVLAERVRAQAQARLGLDGSALDAFVGGVLHDAVGLANRDVGGFAEPDPGRFVSATWLLIEESNAPLAAVGVYTVQDYREALTRMLRFLDTLEATRVFQQHAGIPEPLRFEAMTRSAGANIGFAAAFLRLKIIAIAVVEALALESGGNAPVSMFLGDIRTPQGRPERVEDYLPPAPASAPGAADALDPRLLRLMEVGRPEDSRDDLTASPLTAYLYRCLGTAGCAQALCEAERMLAGHSSARQFLAHLPPAMLSGIIDACARIAVSRRERLQALRHQLIPGPEFGAGP
jgi:hypothetical protein